MIYKCVSVEHYRDKEAGIGGGGGLKRFSRTPFFLFFCSTVYRRGLG